MDLGAAGVWWLAAGLLVLGELFVGSFYMLMLALGCAGGAVAAHLGVGLPAQLIAAALIGAGTTGLWHLRRARAPRSAPVQSNRDALLDIGQTLQVQAWDAQGSARVSYRGSDWTAEFRGPGAAAPGLHRIIAVQGNRLIVEPAEP
ncbi:MAG TPA: NfeD family protein [Rubrivivax sp.]|nr:NfeD family protein [Pseudomonadota bacterium]MCW5639594.1 NfeD family protein [Rubrivivax sp.]HOW48886.1 NfeD family protein [Rubrivivax sp.]HRY90290.1 NfeD family protein [Rubrivivax sp.]HRZ62403.1 NfeD family protein [Rubrivivax sp.]